MAVEQIERTAAALRTLAEGKLPADIPDDCPLAGQLTALVESLSEIQGLALNLSRGDLEPRPSRSRGPVAGSLKALQANFASLPPVVCALRDINQVLLNLLLNAVHAVRDAAGEGGRRGQIRVRTASETDAVRIEISDNGCGVPEAVRERVFDPFFTTRPVGQGRGQGLTIAHQIVVEKHRGALTFESEVGRGTTFVIRLPVQPSGAKDGASIL